MPLHHLLMKACYCSTAPRGIVLYWVRRFSCGEQATALRLWNSERDGIWKMYDTSTCWHQEQNLFSMVCCASTIVPRSSEAPCEMSLEKSIGENLGSIAMKDRSLILQRASTVVPRAMQVTLMWPSSISTDKQGDVHRAMSTIVVVGFARRKMQWDGG